MEIIRLFSNLNTAHCITLLVHIMISIKNIFFFIIEVFIRVFKFTFTRNGHRLKAKMMGIGTGLLLQIFD